mgnify:CR=1 FL=1
MADWQCTSTLLQLYTTLVYESMTAKCVDFQKKKRKTETDIAIFEKTDTETDTDLKKTDENTEYRHRLKKPTPTHH